jgi:hypothetical protein
MCRETAISFYAYIVSNGKAEILSVPVNEALSITIASSIPAEMSDERHVVKASPALKLTIMAMVEKIKGFPTIYYEGSNLVTGNAVHVFEVGFVQSRILPPPCVRPITIQHSCSCCRWDY